MVSFPSHSTFTTPDLVSYKLSVLEAWDLHAKHSPTHPVYVFPDQEGGTTTITWSSAVHAIHRTARIVQQRLGAATCSKRPVVGILSSADSLTYLGLVTGLIRAGCVPFALSTRNSPQAIAHLIQQMECKHLFVSGDPAMVSLDDSASQLLNEAQYDVQRYPIPTYEDMYAAPNSEGLLPPMEPADMESPALIIHSSGSTAFPKPIILTHRTMVQFAIAPTYGAMDICGHVLSMHALPPFHALGIMPLLWATATGLTTATWAPHSRPASRTAETVLDAALATGCTMILTTPYFIEQWAADESVLHALQSFKHVLFSGAPLTQDVGDALSAKGVSLVTLYGATEMNAISLLFPDSIDPAEGEWSYFKLAPNVKSYFKPFDQDGVAGVYEAIWVSTPIHTLSIVNTTVDGAPAYNTGDLLSPHPSKPGFWRVYGRADDQIMLATGEKTNPGPLEAILLRSPYVAGAVMFGRGRFQSGVLLEPATELRDPASRAQFVENVWPVVEEANTFAPQHSRIFKEMIVVAHPDKPFDRTPKGTIRRRVVVAAYDEEINAVYEAMESSGSTATDDLELLLEDKQHVASFVRNLVKRVMKKSLGDADDLFQFGCDSLQATYIRNGLLRALRQSASKTSLPFSFVYQNPSIAALTHALASASAASAQSKPDEMRAMVAELTQDFPAHRASLPVPADETILLTGSTGGIGSYILGRLLEVQSVKRVFVLNRAGAGDSRARQVGMLKDRGVDPALADDARVTFLEGDTTLPYFGLAPEVYEELRTSVTSILHNAWKVDFNLALTSFRPNIVGVRKLIDLALVSPFEQPPKMVFVSSISATHNWPVTQEMPEEPIVHAEIAAGIGYSESKWVAERILHVAGEETPLEPVVVRLGQACGGRNGAWSVQEWFPSLVKSSTEMGCIPRGSGSISWVPAHSAAAAIVDFRAAPARYVHLVHPTPVMWNDVVVPLAALLKLELVPYSAWLARLERLAALNPGSPSPAAKILDFFRVTTSEPEGDGVREALGFPILSTKHAVRVSEAMEELQTHLIGEAEAKQWLAYWVSKGYIKA